MKKKLLSWLLVAALVITMVPGSAFAVTQQPAEKKIMLGTTGLNSPERVDKGPMETQYNPQDYIYFGKNQGTNPIKWRVLDATISNDGSTPGVFMVTEDLIAPDKEGIPYELIYGDPNASPSEIINNTKRPDGTPNGPWKGSLAQKWCKDFLGESGSDVVDGFTKNERDSLLAITKTDEALYRPSTEPKVPGYVVNTTVSGL